MQVRAVGLATWGLGPHPLDLNYYYYNEKFRLHNNLLAWFPGSFGGHAKVYSGRQMQPGNKAKSSLYLLVIASHCFTTLCKPLITLFVMTLQWMFLNRHAVPMHLPNTLLAWSLISTLMHSTLICYSRTMHYVCIVHTYPVMEPRLTLYQPMTHRCVMTFVNCP